MCGIAGFVSKSFSKRDLVEMTDLMHHRGPDANGFFYDDQFNTGLGHRRLSIIDLSDAANQPFLSENERYIMVFNGEIYNYQEIGNQILAIKGNEPISHSFRTNSDTEVLIEGFNMWGSRRLPEKLNGMFAFAIFDKKEERLFLFRDRVGIKPLYYFYQEGEIAFASELKSLVKLLKKKKKLTINHSAIHQFLYLGYIPNEQTIFNEILKFPAGHCGIFEKGKLQLEEFWTPEKLIRSETVTDENKAIKQLDKLITSSVERRMISDVPLGAFLSGGVDSSVVTSIAQKIDDRPIKTFSIGFEEAKFNEGEWAAKVAKYLNTEHHPFLLSEKDAIERVDLITKSYDQPFADASAVPTMLVSEMARKHVTVALSGDGGDELFMGYGMYNWAKRLAKPYIKYGSPVLNLGLSLSKQNRKQRAAWMFAWKNSQRMRSHIFSQEQYFFAEKELSKVLKSQKDSIQWINENFSAHHRPLSHEESQALFDLKNYLKDDLLVKVDIASMVHSLEVRVPLLDHKVISFALNLDRELKHKNGVGKYLLKKVLEQYLPKELIYRPKWGFGIPLGSWLKTDLKYLTNDFLNSQIIGDYGLVALGEVEKLKQGFFDKNKDYLYNRIWALIILHKWISEYDSM